MPCLSGLTYYICNDGYPTAFAKHDAPQSINELLPLPPINHPPHVPSKARSLHTANEHTSMIEAPLPKPHTHSVSPMPCQTLAPRHSPPRGPSRHSHSHCIALADPTAAASTTRRSGFVNFTALKEACGAGQEVRVCESRVC